MGRRENAVLLAEERSFANGMIAELSRIEGECAKVVGEGATERADVATRRVFDEFEKQLCKIQDEGNE